MYRDDGRFDSVRARACIDDERNVTVEFIEDVLRSRGTDPTKAIRARRSEWFTERANDFGKDWMRTDSNCDRVQTRGHNVGNNFAPGQNDRERTRPKLFCE